MSSVINLTTGKCISGTCQAIESCKLYNDFFLVIIAIAICCIFLGAILTLWGRPRNRRKEKLK